MSRRHEVPHPSAAPNDLSTNRLVDSPPRAATHAFRLEQAGKGPGCTRTSAAGARAHVTSEDMKLDDYRNGAKRLTDEHCTTPAQTVRNWAASWKDIFRLPLEGRFDADGARIGQGIFEPCSLVIARWEFGLLIDATTEKLAQFVALKRRRRRPDRDVH